jgi:hypothetical protein
MGSKKVRLFPRSVLPSNAGVEKVKKSELSIKM